MTTIVCECCGQPIKAKAKRAPSRTFKGWGDFTPALTAARHAAKAALGERWHLVPGATIWARVPSVWVSCKVYGRTSTTPRDIRFPAARYWPAGTLPIGPEYAAPVAREDVTPTILAHRAALRATHARYLADLRDHGRATTPGVTPLYPPRTVALALAAVAKVRHQFAESGALLRHAA